MRRVPLAALFVAASLITILGDAAPALARNVYLNGVKLDASVQMKAQTFTGCDVRIDDAGDVYITAKNVQIVPTDIRPAAPPPPAPPPPPPRAAPSPPPPPPPAQTRVSTSGDKPVWLISRQTQRGVSQYDVDVFINDQFVTKVRSDDDPVVLDISRWISRGTNRVRMIAVKNMGDRRVSSSPTDTLEVLMGEGVLGGSTVRVDKVLVSFKRNANETSNIREDFSFDSGKVAP